VVLAALSFGASSPAWAGARATAGVPSFARALSAYLGQQGRVMWVDATANLDRITTAEGVRDIVARCSKAGINTIVLDAKPISGQVLYPSQVAERLTEWRGKRYPDFDVLGGFAEQCKAAGIELYASFNVLGEGHKYFNVGLAYRKPEWQSVTYAVERAVLAGGGRLPVRDASDPEDPGKPTVYGDGYTLEGGGAPGERLAVQFDSDRRVAGLIDPSLLPGEPLVTPEDGLLMTVSGPAAEWSAANLRAGDLARFEAVGRRLRVTEAASERVAAFVNPLHPEVRKHQIALLKEVVARYPISGVVFDRLRYANLFNDYSDLTRAAFEKWLGKRLSKWPDDVLRFDPVPGEPVRRGPYFRQWLEFRARVIRDFVREATEAVRSVRSDARFGAYVGSWFGEYYGVGVNWASEKFPVRTSWATPTYNEAGYAEFLDWLSTGCYYPIPTRAEARALKRDENATVEAAADLSAMVVANSVPLYAGLYALNYQGRPDAFAQAIEVSLRRTQGVMVFDLSYIYDYGWWEILERAFAQPAEAPHRDAALTAQLRAAQDLVRDTLGAGGSGARLPAVPWQPGGG